MRGPSHPVRPRANLESGTRSIAAPLKDQHAEIGPASVELGQPAGLTSEAELETLAALEVLMGKWRFWSPEVLDQVPSEVVEAYIERVAGQRPGAWSRLAEARAMRAEPAWERMDSLQNFLDRIFENVPEDERHAYAWAAGLPLELVKERRGKDVYSNGAITWVPDGLVVPGNLNLFYSGIVELPRDLRVGGDLHVSETGLRRLPEDMKIGGNLYIRKTLVTEIPRGLEVGSDFDIREAGIRVLPYWLSVRGDFYIGGSPMAKHTDSEIRAMAPGVTGPIIRT